MPSAAVQLADQLAKQLAAQSKDAGVLAKIVSLSASDVAFITAPKDSGFNAAWPSDLPLDTEGFTEAFLGLVSAARSTDARLQKRSDRLVPKKTDEPGFWRCYFGHLQAVLNGTELEEKAPASEAAPVSESEGEAGSDLSAAERKAYEASGLPPPRALAQRRFPPASKMQTTGELKAVQMLAFVKEAASMVCSPETTAVMNAAAEHGGSRGAASELLQSQLELMEAHGYAYYGNTYYGTTYYGTTYYGNTYYGTTSYGTTSCRRTASSVASAASSSRATASCSASLATPRSSPPYAASR